MKVWKKLKGLNFFWLLLKAFMKLTKSCLNHRKSQNKPKSSEKQIVSMFPALWKAFGPTFMSGVLLKLGYDMLIFASPFVLE